MMMGAYRQPSLAVGVCLLAAAAAQDPVPQAWQRLRAMEVTGSAYTRDGVAAALLGDEAAMRALRWRVGKGWAQQVAERVQELHRRGGYLDAVANGDVVDGVLHVEVTPGQRLRCGPIRFQGNRRLASAAIQQALAGVARLAAGDAMSPLRLPVWIEGEFPRAGAAQLQRIRDAVVDAYRDVGRHGVRVAVEVRAIEGLAVPMVTIEDEGAPVRIRGLAIVGEAEEARASALASLPFEPGALATRTLLATWKRRLEASGRYVEVRLPIPDPVAENLDPLQIEVELRPSPTPVGAFASGDVERVDRALQRMAAASRTRDGLRFAMVPDRAFGETIQVLPGVIEWFAADHRSRVQWEKVTVAGLSPTRVAIDFEDGSLRLELGGRAGHWQLAPSLFPQLLIYSVIDQQGAFDFHWRAPLVQRLVGPIDLRLHAATAMQVLQSVDAIEHEQEWLVLRAGEFATHIAVDGAIRESTLSLRWDGVPCQLSVAGAAPPRQGPAGVDGWCLLLGLLVDAVLLEHGRDDDRVASLLRGCSAALMLVAPVVGGAAPAPGDEPPSLTDTQPGSMMGQFVPLVLRGAVCRDWNEHWALHAAALAAVMQQDVAMANESFRTIARGPEHGPLSKRIAAFWCSLLERPALERSLSSLAAQGWTFDALRADVERFAANFPSLQTVPARIGAQWRSQPELQSLFEGLPAGEPGDLAAWRKGVEALWSAGLGDLLRKALLGS